MFHTFLVPLDGSLRAEKAISVAATLARAGSGTVVLVHVIVPLIAQDTGGNVIANETHLVRGRGITESKDYLNEVIERYEQVLSGLHVIIEVSPNSETISATLLSLAIQEQADMIVMCAHADSWLKRWIFGSVTQNTLRHSSLPVLVLNDYEEATVLNNPVRPLRLLVGLDGSDFSEALFSPIGEFLALFPQDHPHELHLLQVVPIPTSLGRFSSATEIKDLYWQEEKRKAEQYLHTLADQLTTGSLAGGKVIVTTEVVVQDDIAETILHLAQERTGTSGEPFNLIALATHGRSGLWRAWSGSVTEHVFGETVLPLFVVCPPAQLTTGPNKQKGTQARKKREPKETPQGPVGLL